MDEKAKSVGQVTSEKKGRNVESRSAEHCVERRNEEEGMLREQGRYCATVDVSRCRAEMASLLDPDTLPGSLLATQVQFRSNVQAYLHIDSLRLPAELGYKRLDLDQNISLEKLIAQRHFE